MECSFEVYIAIQTPAVSCFEQKRMTFAMRPLSFLPLHLWTRAHFEWNISHVQCYTMESQKPLRGQYCAVTTKFPWVISSWPVSANWIHRQRTSFRIFSTKRRKCRWSVAHPPILSIWRPICQHNDRPYKPNECWLTDWLTDCCWHCKRGRWQWAKKTPVPYTISP